MCAQNLSCFLVQLRALFLLELRTQFSLPQIKHQPQPSQLFLVQWPLINSQVSLRHLDLSLDLAHSHLPFVVVHAPCHQRVLHPVSLLPLTEEEFKVLQRPLAGHDKGLSGR